MNTHSSFPTLSAGGFRAYIDLLACASTSWGVRIHALSLFGHKTAVDAIRSRLRMGKGAILPDDASARLGHPETFLTHVRKAGDITHATLLRDPRTLSVSDFLILVRDGEDPARRFHRICDTFITTPLHPNWAAWLWQWAAEHNVLDELSCTGGSAWQCAVDEEALETAVSHAIKTGALTIPDQR